MALANLSVMLLSKAKKHVETLHVISMPMYLENQVILWITQKLTIYTLLMSQHNHHDHDDII